MERFGHLLRIKIGNSSSNRNGTNASPVRTDRTESGSKYSAYRRSYKSACQEDSKQKFFDFWLHQPTNNVIGSFTAQTESQSLSLGNLMEVYGFVLELNQEAVRVIIESEEDVWSKDLRSFVDVYFESTTRTLDFFNTVDNCVKRAETMQLLIRYAVKQFETDSVDRELKANMKKKYSKTLGELNKFKAVGDHFGDEFLTQYDSVYEQQVLLLNEFRKRKVRLDKKQSNVQIRRTLSSVIFEMSTISIQVKNLRTRISSILENVEYDVERKEDEIATRLAMQDILKKVEEFTEKIEAFGANIANCGKFIVWGRVQILEHMVQLPAI
ncbi:hypothetical protein V5N11_001095 [Cardamine amara subsp. amara]|uniref:Uncharacterized protein n=1 Tax=Cardamine amara subsp. amara TaxID=228776 RepID=A0ABD1C5A4_CARAN